MLSALWKRSTPTVCSKGVVAGCVWLMLVAGVHESLAASCAQELDALAVRVRKMLLIPDSPSKREKEKQASKEHLEFNWDAVAWFSIAQASLPSILEKAQKAYDAGDYATALEQWQCALEVQQKVREQFPGLAGRSLPDLVGGLFPGLAEEQDDVVQFLRFHGEGTAALHSKIGHVYAQLAKDRQALEHFQQAQAIHRAIGNPKGEGESLTHMSEVNLRLSRYAEALNQLHQALNKYREAKDPKGEGESLTHMGEVNLRLSRYAEAFDQLHQALRLYQAIQERAGEGDVLGHIGTAYMGLGQYQQAQKHFQQALRSHRDLGRRREEGETLRHLATVYEALVDYSRALDAYQQALAIHHLLNDTQGKSRALTHIGDVYTKRQEYPVAQAYYDQALALTRLTNDRYGEGTNLSHLGWVAAKLEHDDDALRRLEDALDILQTLEASESLWQTQRRLGFVQAKRQQHEASVEAYTQAITTLEAVRAGVGEASHKISFWQDKVEVYDELLALLSQLYSQQPHTPYAHQAFEVFERKQARVFLEQIGESSARRFRGLPDSDIDEETRLLQAVAHLHTLLGTERAKPQRNLALIQGLEKQLDALKADLRGFDQRLQREHPDYYMLKHPRPVALDDLRTHVLRSHELLLMYNVMRDRTLLWLVEPQGLSLFNIPIGEQALQDRVDALRQGMQTAWRTRGADVATASQPTRFAQESYALYELLLPNQKVRKLLTESHLAYIVPTGPLYSLPFEALVTKLTPDAQAGRYLLEDVPLAYVASASLLKTLRAAAQRSPSAAPYPLLAFADPIYDAVPARGATTTTLPAVPSASDHNPWKGEFPALPETAEEARTIAALLAAPPASEPLQLREAASRATVLRFNTAQRLKDYRYLLFATHGVLPAPSRFTQPALVLSYPQTHEGYLTMADVLSLQLNAQLVTLSACHTGEGQQERGEGVMGLTRAFMYAGTPAVAVTLWSVESLSATHLSVGLFRFLKELPNPAQALRASKLCLLRGTQGEQYRHPYYWAPFVVFGDAGPSKASPTAGENMACK